MIKIIPNKKNIGAEIICDLRKLSKKDLKSLKSALYKYGVIFFKNQNLTSGMYLKFAKNFGKLANYPRLKGLSKKYPQITVVQRKRTDNGPSFGEQFHTDSIYTSKPPRFTMLLSKLVPKKGIANKDAGIRPIKVLKIAVNVSAAIISLSLIGAINKFVKFLLQISSRNIIL